jgi:geranylgeranyl diphosphate synthase type II
LSRSLLQQDRTKGESVLNQTMTIAEYIGEQVAKVEDALKQSIPSEWQIPPTLRAAITYSLLAGGKRMRPIFVLAAAQSLDGDEQAALTVACAVEMIHTYSLIHDDLPAMDNDDFRRGKLTNHKVYGEAMALLAGDALLTHAFYTLVQVHRSSQIPAHQVLAIIEELSVLSGAKGMVGGQAADMIAEQGITDQTNLDFIHTHKTGDLMVCSLKAGGRIGNATEQQLQALAQFGYNIGLAFQIQDDILDLTADEHKLGKPLKSDEKLKKVTYPYFIGLDASLAKVRQLTEHAQQVIRSANFPNPERLLQLADYLMRRDH